MNTTMFTWRSGDSLRELVLAFQNLGSEDQTQVVTLGGTCHHPVSRLPGLNYYYSRAEPKIKYTYAK